jgi:hypothetical protein
MRLLRSWGMLLWFTSIAAFVVWGLMSQPVSPAAILERIGLMQVLAALALILAGKFLTILLVGHVLAAFGESRGLKFAWYAYSIADIAKYLPGGIWGITGRLHIFHRAGIQLWHAGRMLLVETLVLVAFSFSVGALAIVSVRLGWDYRSSILILAALPVLALTVRMLIPWGESARWVTTTAQQLLAWVCFGCSFAVVAAPNWNAFATVAGIFNVGFAAGTVAVFAPSGLGVREAVIAWLGGESAQANTRLLIELAVIHRFIWIAADFLTLIPALAFRKSVNARMAVSTPDAGTSPGS